ncbi:hypothetical protein LZ012_07475 [Dechloromonas sp. XY25]|uniref:Ankyrin repeat domain-containing protein n=1 Tax=Dechloromonas hankyongensis TaxID=2908002 RepID=A0ABS9K138_9RHOO|nr:hypothetical protein [Dechloromonas hankyongensis]MCG2576831.1 hypothetical protein [Dechloromonas hankyongensis]
MTRIVLIDAHTVMHTGCCRPLSARAMHLNPEIIRIKLSSPRPTMDAGNDCTPLHIAARHDLFATRGPIRACGIYRVPPQGVPS